MGIMISQHNIVHVFFEKKKSFLVRYNRCHNVRPCNDEYKYDLKDIKKKKKYR